MAEEPDVIRHQIDETRESLTEKLESLEGQVKDAVGAVTDTIETVKNTVENTVESVKSGVEDTVESVKTSLSDTVDSVKETFDLPRQIDRHPWAAVGCSLAAGVVAGYLLWPRRRTYYPGIPGMNHVIPGYRAERPAESLREAARPEPAAPGFLEGLLSSFEGELGKIKQTAIGALVGMARDAIKDALPPSLSDSVSEIMDNVTRHAGGDPVRGPVLEPEHAGSGDAARG
jgi:ElaB/YqjD/DUF883 family membrane-anchored ribosome-binding protein